MRKNSNTYTILYAMAVVAVMGIIIATLSIVLKDSQEKNIDIEKKTNILKTIDKGGDSKEIAYIEAEYDKYITDSYLVNLKGERIEGDAFNFNLKQALILPEAERTVPMFVSKEGNNTKYIIPLQGNGLWGAIWGYIALDSDLSTVVGANFDHSGETPGLGAEISTKKYQSHFTGKKIYKGDILSSIKIVKPGVKLDEYSVDGISGGTITSEGLESMISNCLSNYKVYFTKLRKGIKK